MATEEAIFFGFVSLLCLAMLWRGRHDNGAWRQMRTTAVVGLVIFGVMTTVCLMGYGFGQGGRGLQHP